MIQPLWKSVWRFLKKLKIELPYDPAIPLLGIHLEKNCNLKRYMHPYVHSSIIYNSQDMEAKIKKLWYINTVEYCLAIKRNTFESVLMRWMNVEPII